MDITKLAELSRIDITPEEKRKYEAEIGSIIEYVERVQDAVSPDTTPADREAGAVKNVMREDGDPHERGKYTEDLLSQAPQREGDFIRVKKIL